MTPFLTGVAAGALATVAGFVGFVGCGSIALVYQDYRRLADLVRSHLEPKPKATPPQA